MATTTDPENAGRRKRLSLLSQDGQARIEQQSPGLIGFVESAPLYQPGPRRKLPSWAKHLRDLRPLKLVD